MAIPTGEIYLLKNVPLTNTYEHTIDFKDSAEQFNYFMGFLKTTINKFSYIRKEREFLAVEMPLSSLDDVNYLMFRSADGERLYYAFVTDKAYTNPSSSAVFYTIDVMQTFQFDYKWNASYIAQSHVDRWTAEHKPIYSKTDEGIDYGTEYSIETAYKIQQSTALRWLLVTMKDYDAILDSGYSTDSTYTKPAPATFVSFLIPFIISGTALGVGPTGTQVYPTTCTIKNGASVIVGADSYVIDGYETLVKGMQKGALGDYITSISLLSYNPFVTESSVTDSVVNKCTATLNSDCSFGIAKLKVHGTNGATGRFLAIRAAESSVFKGILARDDWNIGLTESLPTDKQWTEIKENPYTTKRDKRFESKLLCAPYRYNLLSDWRNSPVIFKNEYMTTDKIEVNYSFAISHNAPFRFWIKDYKRDPEGRYTCLTQSIAPDFPVINDAYNGYILQNKNTIQANITNAMINAGAGVISGAISGGGMGGAAGAVFGAVSGAAAGALNVSAMIRSENAKQADLRAVPDGVINNNDSAFAVTDKTDILTFYRMKICCENEEIISEIFNMSGYKVNRVDIPNTRSRTRFNYIKTIGANITGAISQTYLSQIKEIFNTGITLWHYIPGNFKMLDYSYENIEVTLI